ncbi:GOLPH3/VPS74 family protein [Micromonospora musae]|uniref:GOLPH3/VPS74 family protein n=1 Tax=Micromonospora musae TaxID=1894970 RepID=UPI003F4D8932
MSVPRLPLRDELFLLGHNDDTGRPHVHRRALALGLAGAVLIDLFLAGRIVLGPTGDRPAGARWLRLHGENPVGDLIADTAIAVIHHGHTTPTTNAFLRSFAGDLYERTRGGLVAAGVLRHHARRRLGGLARTDTYLATDTKWSVVARARLRFLAEGREPPVDHSAALAGLVAALGLTAHLYLNDDTAVLTERLKTIADQHYRPVREITAAVDAAIGDLATATYR